MNKIELKVKGGLLKAIVIEDPEYPGFDIGFIVFLSSYDC